MARKTTQAAFAKWAEDGANVDLVLEMLVSGVTLQKASVALKQPYTCLHPFFHSTPELQGRYEAALRAWADQKMGEAMEIADGVKPDRDHVAKAKLRVEVRQNQAKALYRERWGDTLTVKKDVTLGVDAALLGRADELLRLASERVVGGSDSPALSPPASVDAE